MVSKPARGLHDVAALKCSKGWWFFHNIKKSLALEHINKNKVNYTKLWFWVSVRKLYFLKNIRNMREGCKSCP